MRHRQVICDKPVNIRSSAYLSYLSLSRDKRYDRLRNLVRWCARCDRGVGIGVLEGYV